MITLCVCLCVTLQCSVSCSGGQQQREVNCVSEQDLAIMPNSLCEKISKPETLRKCNMQECKTNTGLYATLKLSLSTYIRNVHAITVYIFFFMSAVCFFCMVFDLWLTSFRMQVQFAGRTPCPLASVTSWSCWVAALSGRSKDSVVSPVGHSQSYTPTYI